MYHMYPNYSDQPEERGLGGLGHYDYPVYETEQPKQETDVPVVPSPQAERALGYVSINGMTVE